MKEQTIERYKNQLLKLREQVREEIQDSLEALPEEVRPIGEHDQEPSESAEKELALERNEETIYQAINATLRRMEAGTFGQCTRCGARIPKARLDAIPYTPYCIGCERKIEEEA